MTAPTSLWDMSTSAASNTSVQGNSIAESCAPSGINDAIRAVVAQALGAVKEVTASGTDTYAATLAPAPDALSDGMTVRIRFTNANTLTTPTLNINGLGNKTITKNGGAALVAGDIPAGHDADLTYVSSGTTWQLKNPKIGVVAGTGISLSTQTVSLDPSYLRSYLAGLTCSPNATTTKIDVAAGVAVDSANAALMTTVGFTIDCTTTGANGLDTSTLGASAWYHVYLIGKTDGTTAGLISLQATTPSPMPSGYTLKRRIGSVKTTGGSVFTAFFQTGDKFEWKAPVLDVNSVTPTSGQQNTVTLASVPTGVVVEAIVAGAASYASGGATVLLVYSTSLTSAPAVGIVTPAAGTLEGAYWRVTTNSSAQIITKLTYGGSTGYSLETLGWIDTRGRNS